MAEHSDSCVSDVEPRGVSWRKSSVSTTQPEACLEATCAADPMLVRDSKDQLGPRLAFPRRAWNVFIAELGASRLDRQTL
ncbi:MAG TPA: DUF397 domain-containing protein [Actinophytocola sp.]|uniref:DUF397 domain-containing protein n=1 Tax=Actinophytocola sp. TaxID=1872138 RepID=UPI002DDCBC23|nr:DUF397 domain-containing protein [Actinophytocola sp.]HEV2784560.1 DUF397 domain-containing protein [Actinophytocola sp.]